MGGNEISLESIIDSGKPVTEISSKPLATHENAKLVDVLGAMISKNIRKMPVIDESGHLKGIISSIDILDLFGGGEKYNIFKMNRERVDMKISDIMTRHVRTIHHTTSIRKALDVFRHEKIGFFPVVDSKKLVSIVSEWDFMKLVKENTGVKVREVMVERPIFVRRDYTVYDVARMMCKGGTRRLPVVENNILLGVVTPVDVLSYLKQKGTYSGFFSDKTRIEDIMKRKTVTIDGGSDVSHAVSLMTGMNVGGLPVIDDEELAGIITQRDIVDAFV